MTPETLVFFLTILLGLVHIGVLGTFTRPIYGMQALMGTRDGLPDSDNVGLNRALRAYNNFRETVPWALGLLILVQVTGDAGTATAIGGWLYLLARIAYIPCYLYGFNPWRTVMWVLSMLGIVTLLLALL